MAKNNPCQRPGCAKPGTSRAMTDPARHQTVELHLCDECYDSARANDEPPDWLRELLTHIGLVG